MLNVGKVARGRTGAGLLQRVLDRLFVALENKRRVVAQLPEILKGLEVGDKLKNWVCATSMQNKVTMESFD